MTSLETQFRASIDPADLQLALLCTSGKDYVGQQPNIELEMADLPRPRPKPEPARSWVPGRPGELNGPGDMKWGNGFGVSGPDAGYALALAKQREYDLSDGEHRANADAAVAAVAAARSSLYGRAPTGKDLDLALVLLGYDGGVPDAARSDLARNRIGWFTGAAHHPVKLVDFIARLSPDVLRLTADEARARMAQGEQLVG